MSKLVFCWRAGLALFAASPFLLTASELRAEPRTSRADEDLPFSEDVSEKSSSQSSSAGSPRLYARAGYAWFRQARSLALEHNVKPALRLLLTTPIAPNLELGGALTGVLSNADYGVWAAYAVGRYAIITSDNYQLAASLGLGIGHNAPILHDDLMSEAVVLPYAMASLESLWRVSKSLSVGVALETEQLSVVHLGAVVAWR